jgi:hypothetical protein
MILNTDSPTSSTRFVLDPDSQRKSLGEKPPRLESSCYHVCFRAHRDHKPERADGIQGCFLFRLGAGRAGIASAVDLQ